MKKKFCLKKITISFFAIFVLLITLFILLNSFLCKKYSEQRYEVDANLLIGLCDYYSEIYENPLRFIEYKFFRKKIINSFFEMNSDRLKENYALLYSLENIKTYKDVERFWTGVGLTISDVLKVRCYDLDESEIKFIIIVRRYPFLKNDKVFILLKTPVIEFGPDLIID